MATRAFTTSQRANGVIAVTWAGLLNGDDGAPVEVPWLAEKSMQIKGTFGVGGAARPEGSNDVTTPTYAQLRDFANAVINITADDVKQIQENPLLVRPRVTAGDGTTNLTAILVCAPHFKI